MGSTLTYVGMPSYAEISERLQALELPPTDRMHFVDTLNNALFRHSGCVPGMISGPEYRFILSCALDSYAARSRGTVLHVPAMRLLAMLVDDQTVIREANRPLFAGRRLHIVRCGAEN